MPQISRTKSRRSLAWAMLIAAISLEICALSLLEIFTNANRAMLGKVILLALMNLSYFLMSLTLRDIAVGVAYAVWEIVGGIGVLVVSFIFFAPNLSTAQICGIVVGFTGIVLIILGEKHEKFSSNSINSSSNPQNSGLNLSQNSSQKA